jgi:hypothetical protein
MSTTSGHAWFPCVDAHVVDDVVLGPHGSRVGTSGPGSSDGGIQDDVVRAWVEGEGFAIVHGVGGDGLVSKSVKIPENDYEL